MRRLNKIKNPWCSTIFIVFTFSFIYLKPLYSQTIYPAKHEEKFTHYSNEQGLFSQSIRCLLQDKKGRLWIAAQDGLLVYDGNHFKKFTASDGFGTYDVGALCEDNEGKIWIGSMYGLFYYDGVRLNRVDTVGNRLPRSVCWSFFKDHDGTIWAGTQYGVTHFNPMNPKKPFIKNYYVREPNKLQPVGLVKRKNDKTIIVGSHAGFFTLIKDSLYKQNDLPSYISCFYEFEDGTEWYGGWDRPLYIKRKNRKDTTISFRSGILQFVEDNDKNVWIITWENSVFKYDGTNFIHYSKNEGLNFSGFWSGLCDKEGNVWFGSWGKGIYKFNNNGIYTLSQKKGLCSDVIYGITKDTLNGNFYLASDNCVSIYDPEKSNFTNFTHCENEPLTSITNIFIGKNNDLNILSYGMRGYKIAGNKIYKEKWLCGFQGELDKDGFYKIIREKGWCVFKHPDSTITCIASKNNRTIPNEGFYKCKNNNYILFNVFHGFNYYTSGETSYYFDNKNGFIFEAAKCATEDPNGNYWLGTNGRGIYVVKMINDTTIKLLDSMSTFNNLSSNIIHSIHFVNNKLIAGTANGLSILDWNNYQSGIKTFKTVNKDEGLVNSAATVRYIDKTQLWISTNDGVHVVDIDKLRNNTSENTLYLSDIKINYNTINWEKEGFSISNEGIPVNVKLSHNQNHLTFEYNAVCLTAPGKVRFRHMLRGAEKDWAPITALNKVTYSNISPGTYTLIITSCNNDGVWNSTPIEYSFTILPPFWKTWWFNSMIVILFFVAIYMFIKWREKALTKEMTVLENKVEERTYQLKEALHIVEEKKSEILDSIQYAKRIQFTLLAHENLLNKYLSKEKNENALTQNYGLLFKPKDIVSGDFYWATTITDKNNIDVFYLAVCDSTGHGVPGAFMSLLNINYMNEAITEKKLDSPAEIFNYVKQQLIQNISKDGAQDGMDGILIRIYRTNNSIHIQYAAANNAPIFISKNELVQLPYSKIPVGKSLKTEMFQNYEIEATPGDIIWLYTDGFADQFGGTKGKKLMYKKFNEILLQESLHSMDKQIAVLDSYFENWKGDLEQVDDVCVIGIKI